MESVNYRANKASNYLQCLPDDVLMQIFKYLSPTDLSKIRMLIRNKIWERSPYRFDEKGHGTKSITNTIIQASGLSKDRKSVFDLPDKVLYEELFKYLSFDDLLKIQVLCRRLRLLVDPLVWHSIYVYHHNFYYDMPWMGYRRMHWNVFMELSRSRELKTHLIKRLTFSNDRCLNLVWLQHLQEKLTRCSIAVSEITQQEFVDYMRGADFHSRRFYVPDSDVNSIDTVKVVYADQDFFENWLPRMTSLEYLDIDTIENVQVQNRFVIHSLRISENRFIRQSISSDSRGLVNEISEIFDLSKLRWLSLWDTPSNWNTISKMLTSITMLEIDGTIQHLPYNSLREMNYIRDIPDEDFEYLFFHSITYLTVNTIRDSESSELRLMNKLKRLSTLKELRVNHTTYRIVMLLVVGIFFSEILSLIIIWYCRPFKNHKEDPEDHQPEEHIRIVDFPDELLQEIFEYLETYEHLMMRMACKRFNRLIEPLIWHSIFVYAPSDVNNIGEPWANYCKISEDIFIEMSTSKKLKTKLMKRLVFERDCFSLKWFQSLATGLGGCSIAIDHIGNQKLFKGLTIFNNSSEQLFWWRELGYLDARLGGKLDGFPDLHLIKSLKMPRADQNFFHNWISNMTSLQSLHIVELKPVSIERKIRLVNLYVDKFEYLVYVGRIFDFSTLKSLHLGSLLPTWGTVSQELFLISNISITDTILYLPYYTLRELHYSEDIPWGDFSYILRHPITYLSSNPFVKDETEEKKEAISVMKELKGMTTLRTLRIRKTTFRFAQ
ncbi:uncharacterized protein J8A68_001013 [[Candida] subhashii]|uniref:F-box domain-containing protein n=1 Tax=[Candida] subhashii TaxID=561895 RepID=A0A8J5QSI1_9ASCO|nr:uncharacterized protein J8A68_001013 [[Candida] subhashii]KAG7665325.1 hypothetical protein J8A68_001013 [[Candida] subhashii]